MTIDDELVLELIKPDVKGNVSTKALIVSIIGTNGILYKLEEPTHYFRTYGAGQNERTELVRITPDITIKIKPKKGIKEALKKIAIEAAIGPEAGVAFELENDIHWDFQHSLRQIKRYKRKFKDTRIIIPDDFKRFAPLYKHEGFRVYLWKARRIWECLRCGAETEKEGPVAPKCQKCNNNSQNDFRLVGLRDTCIVEFT